MCSQLHNFLYLRVKSPQLGRPRPEDSLDRFQQDSEQSIMNSAVLHTMFGNSCSLLPDAPSDSSFGPAPLELPYLGSRGGLTAVLYWWGLQGLQAVNLHDFALLIWRFGTCFG